MNFKTMVATIFVALLAGFVSADYRDYPDISKREIHQKQHLYDRYERGKELSLDEAEELQMFIDACDYNKMILTVDGVDRSHDEERIRFDLICFSIRGEQS